ncbi:POP1-domain-containing protein [Ceratobasidium sp. AG-I]|nr:POP1-domain-containing protein [Ceratobasidium sp. AG-I]
MQGLPSTIDVERFAQARNFEIGAMQSAMKSAKATASHRVWQTLPRHLRRRAASHDVRRVPVRLREKAKFEIEPAKRKKFMKLLRRKTRLASGSKRTERFLKRQKNKTWLETHLWHAKRMHMQDVWGYRLAIRPTEKSYRPSHRAAVHGSTIHDVSYISTLELAGELKVLCSLLKQCCDPCGVGPWAARYCSGVRVCHTHMYGAGSWPNGLIAPATLIWKPVIGVPTASSSETRVPPHEPTDTSLSPARSLWIRVHPAALKDTIASLKAAANQLAVADQVEITDLSGDLNAFEMVGPRTSQVIHGALKLAGNGAEARKFWQALKNARSPGSFSPGMVVGLNVHDPRLHYPPANGKIDDDIFKSENTMIVPDPKLAQSGLWEQDLRDKRRTPTFKKADLDRRRSTNLVPGAPLRPIEKDDRIPVILIQHTISTTHTQTNNHATQPLHGWTILLPPSWSMAFLTSLIHTGTRAVGLTAQRHQRLESSCPHFPEDYVGTPVYVDSVTKQAATEQAKWERTPKGKRINYESMGTTHPWMSDWNGLVGGSPSHGDLIPTDHINPQPDVMPPWIFPSTEIVQFIVQVAKAPTGNGAQTFSEQINSTRARRELPALDEITTRRLFDSALVHVRVDMLGRGNPKDRAILCRVVNSDHPSGQKNATQIQGGQNENDELIPTHAESLAVIGHITSGSFSLQLGCGHGTGAIRLKDMVEMTRKSTTETKVSIEAVKVRDLENGIWRPASLALI